MTKPSDVKTTLINVGQEWKHVFMSCLVINLLAYGFYLIHITYAVDDYDYIFMSSKAIVSGRWVIDFLHNSVCQTSLMPTVLPVFCMIFNILTGIGLCKLWSIRDFARVIVVTLWTTHPYLLDMYNFRLIAFPFSIGYFLAIVALCMEPRNKIGYIFPIILLYLAMSIYQPILGFAIAAIMIQVLLMSFRENFSADSIRESAKLFVRTLFILGVSVVVYLVVTKLIFIIFNVEANSRLQAGFISDFDQLKAKIAVVISVLFVRLAPIKEFILPFIGKLAIFVIYAAAMLTIIKRASKFSGGLLALLWLALIPLGAILFLLPLEALSVPWRVCMGLVVFFVGMFALTQESDSQVVRRGGLTIGCFLVVYFILNNNAILYKQHLTNQRDLFMGNQMIAKIQSLNGYRPGMELAIIGKVQKETFSKEGKGNLEVIHDYIKHCSIRRYSLATSAFETDWSKYSFLLNYMNLELKQCGPKKLNGLRKFAVDRKPWPDRSSVFIQDDAIVLILSGDDE